MLNEKIRSFRKIKGLTLKELSNKMCTSLPHLSAMECGDRNISLSTLSKLSLALNVPLWLFFLDADIQKIKENNSELYLHLLSYIEDLK